jgi:hypothetical protein
MTGQMIGQLILWLIVAVVAIAIIYWLMQLALPALHRRRPRSCEPAFSARRW